MALNLSPAIHCPTPYPATTTEFRATFHGGIYRKAWTLWDRTGVSLTMRPLLTPVPLLLGLICALLNGFASAAEKLQTITVWCMGNEGTKIPELAREFEQLHPGTRV